MSNSNSDHKWQEEVEVASGETSAWILVPGWVNYLTATAIPGGGSALIQHTTAKEEDVTDNPGSIQPIDWDAGNVTNPTTRAAAGPVTAVRLSAAGGSAKMELVGQRARR